MPTATRITPRTTKATGAPMRSAVPAPIAPQPATKNASGHRATNCLNSDNARSFVLVPRAWRFLMAHDSVDHPHDTDDAIDFSLRCRFIRLQITRGVLLHT